VQNVLRLGRLFLVLGMAAVIWGAFLYARPAESFVGESSRIVFFHVPMSWIATLAFLLAAVHSGLYLKSRRIENDEAAAGAARLGLLFCTLATVTGSIFAKVMWNSYWNWDPRETSIFFLLLVYGAYLALRSAIDEEHKRARLSAVYSLIAFVSVPFLVFVVPRLYAGLHPDPIINKTGKVDMDPRITLCFLMMLVGFTFLFFWLLNVRVRLARAERRLTESPSAA